jgi:WD40 repeat protein/serine/threonine protein kinase
MDRAQNEKRPGASGGNDRGDAPTLPPVVGSLPEAMATQAKEGLPAAMAANEPVLNFLAPPQAPDEIGRLGPYRVLKVLGQGGMGVVFQAEDVRLQRVVALKAMLPALAEKPEAKERFLREARAAAAIEHDHIVAIHQVDEDRGVPYIAMPFLKGLSLESFLEQKAARGTPLKLAEICKIGREMARGLAAAHERGLIHRDIKPANIWLDAGAGGRVKILDFGLARLSQQGNEKNLTQTGAILGTPAYMAPEQAAGGQVDARADLFSLGVVLYRLCTGQMPFRGPDIISTLMAVAMNEPPAPRSLRPDVPKELSALVMRLLAKDPGERPASASEVARTIAAIEKACLGPRPSASGERQDTIVEPQLRRPSGRPSRSKRALWPWLIGAGAVAALVVVAAIVLFRPRPQDTGLGHQVGGNDREKTPRVSPLSPLALVSRPPKIEGVESWSIEPRGHRGSVYDLLVAWRGDSKQLATGGVDGSVRLWEPSSGELLRILLGHGKKITALAWSLDGKTLASGSDDATVRVWDPDSGKLLATLSKHTGPITALGWSRDGKTLGSGSEDKLVFLWDPRSGEVRRKFDRHHTAITQVGGGRGTEFVSSDSTNIVIWEAGTGKLVKSHRIAGASRWHHVVIHRSGATEFTVWDPESARTRLLTLKDHAGPIHSWDLSPDGTLLVTGGDKSLSCWDVTSGKLLSTRSIWQGMTQTLSFSPDGRILLSREQFGRRVFLWPTASLRQKDEVKPLQLDSSHRYRDKVRWAPDSNTLTITPYWDVQQQDYDRLALFAASGRRLHTLFPNVHGGGDIAWAPDGNLLAVAHPLKRVRIQEADSAKVLHVADEEPQAEHTDFQSRLDWSPDGKTLAIYHGTHPEKAVRLFDAQTGARLKNGLNGPPMKAVVWSPDSTKLAMADDDAVYLYDPAASKQISKKPIPKLKVHALAWSPDSRVLATGGTSVRLWNATMGEAIPLSFPIPGTIIQAVAWSPDGSTIASGDEAGTIRLYNVQTGAVLQAFQGHEGPVHALAWMPDSKSFRSLGEKDGTAGFWEVGSDKPFHVTKDLPGKACFSPDRRLLVSRHDLTGVQIWESETGQLRGTLLTVQGKPEQYLAVSADGHFRVTGEAGQQLVYVVQTAGGQETLTPAEFQRKHGWTNDPDKVHLTSPE